MSRSLLAMHFREVVLWHWLEFWMYIVSTFVSNVPSEVCETDHIKQNHKHESTTSGRCVVNSLDSWVESLVIGRSAVCVLAMHTVSIHVQTRLLKWTGISGRVDMSANSVGLGLSASSHQESWMVWDLWWLRQCEFQIHSKPCPLWTTVYWNRCGRRWSSGTDYEIASTNSVIARHCIRNWHRGMN
jgi:hypothetical protein